VEWVTHNPETAPVWLKSILEEARDYEGRPPRFETIWNSLPENLTGPIRQLYSDLSVVGAHPRAEGMPLQFRLDDGDGGIVLNVGAHFNLQRLKNCLTCLIQVELSLIKVVEELQSDVLGAVNPEWEAKMTSHVSNTESILTSLRP
jgi:hypothetical protein